MRGLRAAIAGLFVAAATPWAAMAAPPETPAPGLAIYRDGDGIEALLLDGRLRAPGQRFACAGCHGADAEGGGEGATVFPAIGWQRLADPGRAGGPYDASGLARALREGVAPDGRRLGPAMPRYRIDDGQIAALVSHLRTVADDQRRGVTPTAIRLGIAGADPIARQGLLAAAARFNRAGGAFGRQLDPAPLAAPLTDATLLDAEALARLLAPRITAAEDRLIAQDGAGPGPVLRLGQTAAGGQAGVIRVISLVPEHLSPAEAAGLRAAALPAYLYGILLGEAALACGRDLTRACIETALAGLDATHFLRLYHLPAADQARGRRLSPRRPGSRAVPARLRPAPRR